MLVENVRQCVNDLGEVERRTCDLSEVILNWPIRND